MFQTRVGRLEGGTAEEPKEQPLLDRLVCKQLVSRKLPPLPYELRPRLLVDWILNKDFSKALILILIKNPMSSFKMAPY